MSNIINRGIFQIIQLRTHCAVLSLKKYHKFTGDTYTYQITHLRQIKSSNFQKYSKSTFTTESNNMQEDSVKNVHYHDILQAQNDDSVLMIDVREQSEINETGKLPGSIHIPMTNVLPELHLPAEEFKHKYYKNKPDKSTKIIVSCKSGMRSANVQKELQRYGFTDVSNYVGGWTDWESKSKR